MSFGHINLVFLIKFELSVQRAHSKRLVRFTFLALSVLTQELLLHRLENKPAITSVCICVSVLEWIVKTHIHTLARTHTYICKCVVHMGCMRLMLGWGGGLVCIGTKHTCTILTFGIWKYKYNERGHICIFTFVNHN